MKYHRGDLFTEERGERIGILWIILESLRPGELRPYWDFSHSHSR